MTFSEFTFGFAVTHELVLNLYGVPGTGRRTPLPILPSLVTEGKIPFDLLLPLPNLAAPLCLQYKLSEPRKKLPRGVHLVHPRFMASISQSQNDKILKMLGQVKLNAFYCAPTFAKITDLQDYFSKGTVLVNCAFVTPPVLPTIKNTHRLYFNSGPTGYICSDPQEVSALSFAEVVQQGEYQETASLLESLYRSIKHMVKPSGILSKDFDESLPTRQELLPEVLELLELFNSELVATRLRKAWLFHWIRAAMLIYFELDFHLVAQNSGASGAPSEISHRALLPPANPLV